MARQRQYRTCDMCGEEWPVSAKVAREIDDKGEYFCEFCVVTDAAMAYVEDLWTGWDVAIYGE
jgi:hypothetical protein